MRLLGLCGSLRAASTNVQLLDAFARHAPNGVEVKRFSRLAEIPAFNPDLEHLEIPAVEELGRSITDCDGLLVASPEYAHGISGVLKNALDWLVSREEIPGKPVMLVHASARSTTSREHLREVLRTMSCRVFDGRELQVHLMGKDRREIDVTLAETRTRKDIRETLERFAAFMRRG